MYPRRVRANVSAKLEKYWSQIKDMRSWIFIQNKKLLNEVYHLASICWLAGPCGVQTHKKTHFYMFLIFKSYCRVPSCNKNSVTSAFCGGKSISFGFRLFVSATIQWETIQVSWWPYLPVDNARLESQSMGRSDVQFLGHTFPSNNFLTCDLEKMKLICADKTLKSKQLLFWTVTKYSQIHIDPILKP